MKLFSAFLAALLALIGLPLAGQSDPLPPVLSLYPAAGPPGVQLNLIVAGLDEDAELAVWLDDTPVDSPAVTQSGSRLVTLSVPGDAEEGSRITIRAAGGGFDLLGTFHVTGGQPPYTVREGDTLERIAAWFGVYAGDLKLANLDIREYGGIYPGQKLLIPPRRDKSIRLAPAPNLRALRLEQSILPDERWVDVNLSLQQVNVYEGTQLVRRFVVSTGTRRHPTLPGNFKVYLKYEKTNMAGPGYYLVNVPNTLYYDRGYALHGTYWHDNFGTPMSHGCVNLTESDAAWLFDFAPLGAMVMVHD